MWFKCISLIVVVLINSINGLKSDAQVAKIGRRFTYSELRIINLLL